MAKKKHYYYVLVLTNDGPVFVTKVNYLDKTAEWNRLEKPLEMGKDGARDLVIGLCLNFNMAFLVDQPFELDAQPYRYSVGHFEWKYDNEKEESNDEEEV